MNALVPTADIRRWAAIWREAGPALAAIKRSELQRLKTADALAQLADAFDAAVRQARPTVTSGLIAQQELFGRLRQR